MASVLQCRYAQMVDASTVRANIWPACRPAKFFCDFRYCGKKRVSTERLGGCVQSRFRSGLNRKSSILRYNKINCTNIKTVIFDLDGVLIDSSVGIVDTTNFVLRALDFQERQPDEIKPFIGCPLPKMFAEFAPEADYEWIRPLFRQRAREVIVQTSQLLPFVRETLQRLQESGVTMGIGSTKIREHIVGVVDKFSLGAYIDGDAIVGGDEAAPKPEPDIFLLALERLGAHKDSAIVVGDTINDVLAAQAAGVPVVVVESEFGSEAELAAQSGLTRLDNLRRFADLLCENRQDGVGVEAKNT